jgi:hypothetical protein
MFRGKFEFVYRDEQDAGTVAQLLELDNQVLPRKLKVRTIQEGRKVITQVEHESLGTFQAAVEDLLFCERLIEGLLRV